MIESPFWYYSKSYKKPCLIYYLSIHLFILLFIKNGIATIATIAIFTVITPLSFLTYSPYTCPSNRLQYHDNVLCNTELFYPWPGPPSDLLGRPEGKGYPLSIILRFLWLYQIMLNALRNSLHLNSLCNEDGCR
jgi:hypothetical protein